MLCYSRLKRAEFFDFGNLSTNCLLAPDISSPSGKRRQCKQWRRRERERVATSLFICFNNDAGKFLHSVLKVLATSSLHERGERIEKEQTKELRESNISFFFRC